MSTRIVRQITSTRTDLADVGHSLGQRFTSEGAIVAVSVTLAPPPDAVDPFTADVKFTVALETPTGDVVAKRTFEGPQLVWDYFGPLLDVDPPAPPGEYVVVLRAERMTMGWLTADAGVQPPDDGISPLPVIGVALADGEPVEGIRMLGVDTMPAPNPIFRRTFELATLPTSASLAATTLGVGVVSINGVRVGDEVLEPAVTDYDRTVLFRTWDVTHLLNTGSNVVVIEAGRDRYAARGGDVWGWNLAPWHREPVAIARLEIDGTTALVTDAGWETAAGPVTAERFFRGEDHVVGGDPATWEPVVVVSPPSGTPRLAPQPPVRALAPIPPVVVESLHADRTVFDFGQIMTGRFQCRVTGSAGATLSVRSGEQRGADGSVICDNFLVAGEAQLDTLRLDADVSDYIWEPKFGYRGFRWIQVDVQGEARADGVRAVPLYTELDRVGQFSADDPILAWIDAATASTFRNNLHGVPTDTPIYEKNGWTADAHLATEGLLHHFDLRSAFGKWIDDHMDAQRTDGSIPQIIPTPGWGLASDPAWSASAVLVPWYLYREYGDRGILERTESMIRRFADGLVGQLDNGIWRRRTWGDWLSPGHLTGPEGMAPIGTIMSVSVLQHTAHVLRELSDPRADEYAEAAAMVGRAYHREYFEAGTGIYAVPGVGYRQVLNILPLAFDAVPDDHVESVRTGLIGDIEQRTSGHVDCGAVGARHVLPVLSAAGRDDLAVTLLTRRTPPGWGAWYEAGEATLLESWEADARSRNHYFFGSVSAWIQQRVGGLRLLEPGWHRFEVSPVDDPRLRGATIRHRTPLGDAAVSWERGAGGWRIEVTVPAGSTAQVRVAGSEHDLSTGDHLLHIPTRST